MAFWGMSSSGKDASGKLSEIPNWLWELAKQSYGRGNDEYNYGQGKRNDYAAFIQQMIDNGIGTPEEMRALGEQVMPGVNEAIGDRKIRTDRLRGAAQQILGADATADEISAWIDQYGGSITGDKDAADSNVRDTFGRQLAKAEQFGKERVSNIRDVYSGANEILGGTHATTTGRTSADYGALLSELDPEFAAMQERVESFKPGGEARAARVGRSFNPAVASTMARLRRGGIDPTSPEGTSLLQKVDAAKATAMDDSLAGDTATYVGESNKLALNKLGQRQGLTLGRLGDLNQQDTAYGDKRVNLGLRQGDDFRSELRDQEATGRDLDLNKLKLDIDNGRFASGRLDDYFKQRMALPGKRRGMQFEDYGLQQSLEDRANTDDLVGFDLKNTQFDRGTNFRLQDLGRRDRGVDATGRLASESFNRGLQWNNQGTNQTGAAMGGYGDTFSRESVNSGWGKKLLAGVGGAAADLLLPGSGSLVRGAASGGGGGFSLSSIMNKIRGRRPQDAGGYAGGQYGG